MEGYGLKIFRGTVLGRNLCVYEIFHLLTRDFSAASLRCLSEDLSQIGAQLHVARLKFKVVYLNQTMH